MQEVPSSVLLHALCQQAKPGRAPVLGCGRVLQPCTHLGRGATSSPDS